MQRAAPLLSGYLEASALEWLDSAHRDKWKRKLIKYVYLEQVVQTCPFIVLLHIFSCTFLNMISLGNTLGGRRVERQVGNRQAASQNT